VKRFSGEVAEWSNAPDSKSGIRYSRIEGSNPSFSAKCKAPRDTLTRGLFVAAALSVAGVAQRAQSRPMQRTGRGAMKSVVVGAVALALAGCASRSTEVVAKPTDPATYAGWDCERLFDELDAVQQRAADVAYAVDARAGNNMIALGIGVAVFWPALLAMRPDGPEAVQLAELKGRFEALQANVRSRGCGAPAEAMSAQRAAGLPVAAGDRLVYDDRVGAAGAPAHELGLRVSALRRDRIEFSVDIDGRSQPGLWRQDLAGNALADDRLSLLRWHRLLHADLALGEVVSGELMSGSGSQQRARVRGQVVATGPQQVAGREFDVAVVELFGDAPQADRADVAVTRLDGVMAVDRRSGVLLRLELRCANPEFALRRRLLRVEAAPR